MMVSAGKAGRASSPFGRCVSLILSYFMVDNQVLSDILCGESYFIRRILGNTGREDEQPENSDYMS
jgi:hypothetical protein